MIQITTPGCLAEASRIHGITIPVDGGALQL